MLTAGQLHMSLWCIFRCKRCAQSDFLQLKHREEEWAKVWATLLSVLYLEEGISIASTGLHTSRITHYKSKNLTRHACSCMVTHTTTCNALRTQHKTPTKFDVGLSRLVHICALIRGLCAIATTVDPNQKVFKLWNSNTKLANCY